MQFLSSGSDDSKQDLLRSERVLIPEPVAPIFAGAPAAADDTAPKMDPRELLRRYWLLAAALLVMGAACGFVSVVLMTPMYRSNMLLEIQNANGSLAKDGASYEDNDVNIETQIGILRSASFLKRGADRMQADNVPLAPTGTDIFARLRRRILPAIKDPFEAESRGIAVATATFNAQPVVHTRLIELTCESTSPEVAAQFLNSMAAEFQEYSSQSRMETAQKTSDWLSGQIEEAKAKVQDAEDRVREFVAASGNVFAGQDNTLEDTKLAELKGQLAKIQSERIARQTRYELTQKNPAESLAEVLDDGSLRNYKSQLESLMRDRASLETIYTPKHEKVRKIDAQIAVVQKAYQSQINSVIERIRNDYQASVREEKSLTAAYNDESQRVGSQATRAAQFNNLKRDVETQRTMYQSLLAQLNQANLASSVPVNPIRVVEPSAPTGIPYTPRPVINISFGAMIGLVFAGGIAFLRERVDRSIKAPGAARRLFNVPELGVIPNFPESSVVRPKLGVYVGGKAAILNGASDDSATALATWQSGPAFIAESFRGTLASILRNLASGKSQKLILVTSPGPAEGKTTLVQNLGIALAESGRNVLLVDADFRRPHLHRKFNLANDWGLIDLLCEDQPLSEYSPERLGGFTGYPGLSVLPNRVTSSNVSKALYSPRLRTILETLVKRYDMVLLDAPPMLSVADTRIIAPLADALILVLRSGVTNRDDAMEAYDRIREDGLTLLGTVLTDYNLSADRRRKYNYDYGSTE